MVSVQRAYAHALFSDTRCYLCGGEIKHHTRSVLDHVVPKSRGGSDGWANRRLAHTYCDKIKANCTPGEMLERLEREIEIGVDYRGNRMSPGYQHLAHKILRYHARALDD